MFREPDSSTSASLRGRRISSLEPEPAAHDSSTSATARVKPSSDIRGPWVRGATRRAPLCQSCPPPWSPPWPSCGTVSGWAERWPSACTGTHRRAVTGRADERARAGLAWRAYDFLAHLLRLALLQQESALDLLLLTLLFLHAAAQRGVLFSKMRAALLELILLVDRLLEHGLLDPLARSHVAHVLLPKLPLIKLCPTLHDRGQ